MKICLIGLLLHLCMLSFSQSGTDPLISRLDPQKWFALMEKKAEKLQSKIISKSAKTLERLQRQEEKIYRRMLRGKDSAEAKAALADIKIKYEALRQKIKNKTSPTGRGIYIPKLDTLSTTLKFFEQRGMGGDAKNALSAMQSLQGRFEAGEEIKNFIRERKLQLKEQLSGLIFKRDLQKISKEAYYFSQQMNEYRLMLNDASAMERKAVDLLRNSRLFKDFMQRNSQLAALFGMPANPGDPVSMASLAGLQTRAQVNGLLQQQLTAAGPNAASVLSQNIRDAQSQLSSLKEKINQLGGSSSDTEIPENFRPNNQKTKSFFKRLELGANIQSQKPNSYFPVTSDVGVSVGYKLNDKSIIGVGASYKIGWGQSIRNISVSSQGVGFRSFMDWKLKGSFWISGGYEINYHNAFEDIDVLRRLNAWQQSGLVGVSKLVSLKTKLLKKTKLQLFWDFLCYQQVPRTPPLKFRVGYNF